MKEILYRDSFSSPIGALSLLMDEESRVLAVEFSQGFEDREKEFIVKEGKARCGPLKRWLAEYFEGKNPELNLGLRMLGTPFQVSVWKALLRIPYGKTAGYAAIADWIGKPSACRAVGNAVGANPIAIVIPCHRVVKSSGEVGNYGGGRDRKAFLLSHERPC